MHGGQGSGLESYQDILFLHGNIYNSKFNRSLILFILIVLTFYKFVYSSTICDDGIPLDGMWIAKFMNRTD